MADHLARSGGSGGFHLQRLRVDPGEGRKIIEPAQAAAPKPLVITKTNKDVKVVDTTLLPTRTGTRWSSAQERVQADAGQRADPGGPPRRQEVRLQERRTGPRDRSQPCTPDEARPDRRLGERPAHSVDQARLRQGDRRRSGGSASGEHPGRRREPASIGELFPGPKVTGSVTNKSQLDQLKLVVFAVARSGGKVVAAGRGGLKKLKVGDSHAYTAFFIGNPSGGDLTVTVPPTVFK